MQKLEIEIRFKVSSSMYSRMHLLMMTKDFTQSELMRQATREILERYEPEIVSALQAQSETAD
jgi:hypothetical protein